MNNFFALYIFKRVVDSLFHGLAEDKDLLLYFFGISNIFNKIK